MMQNRHDPDELLKIELGSRSTPEALGYALLISVNCIAHSWCYFKSIRICFSGMLRYRILTAASVAGTAHKITPCLFTRRIDIDESETNPAVDAQLLYRAGRSCDYATDCSTTVPALL